MSDTSFGGPYPHLQHHQHPQGLGTAPGTTGGGALPGGTTSMDGAMGHMYPSAPLNVHHQHPPHPQQHLMHQPPQLHPAPPLPHPHPRPHHHQQAGPSVSLSPIARTGALGAMQHHPAVSTSSSPPFRNVFQRLAPPGEPSRDPRLLAYDSLPPQTKPTTAVPLVSALPPPAAPAQSASPIKEAQNGSPSSASASASAGASAAAKVDSKKRTSKACETCRVRRTKCISSSGSLPCDPCKTLGVADDCIVRVKARPNRALPRTLMENGITTGPQFDAAEVARLGRFANTDMFTVDRTRESHIRSASSRTPEVSTAKLAGSLQPDSTRSKLPDAMQRFVPTTTPVVEAPHAGVLHTTFVEDIEASLESWARERGSQLNLSLSAPSPLRALVDHPPPLPPLNTTVEEQAMNTFLRLLGSYFDFLPSQRVTDLTTRYHTAPHTLSVDQRCLVWACICLGMFRERRWPANDTRSVMTRKRDRSTSNSTAAHPTPGALGLGAAGTAGPGPATTSGASMGMAGGLAPPGAGSGRNGDGSSFDYGGRDMGNASYEEAPYYAACVRGLDEWGSASSTALISLHVLHLYVLAAGGPQDMRDILGRMAWQVRELGFHRDVTAKLYPASDAADRLFFMTLYKDSWFATLTGLPPYLTTGTFDVQFSRPFPTPLDPSPPPPQRPTAAGGSIEGDGTSTSEGREYHRGIDAHPFLVQLTLFENELATLMHVPDTQISIDVVLDLERKWGDWMVVFRDDQLKGEKPMHHAFSMIRFHWIRLMLRTPFLSSSSLRLSSLSIISRSIAQILNTYATFAHTQVFIASYGELKRIMTCGYLLCVCFWERELDRNETEILMGLCEALVRKLEQAERQGDGGVARGKTQILRKLAALLDLNPKSPASPHLALETEPEEALADPSSASAEAAGLGNPQDFEAQQTVDALFAYPYSLDWTMPENVENWLGLGTAECMAAGDQFGNAGMEMQGMNGQGDLYRTI